MNRHTILLLILLQPLCLPLVHAQNNSSTPSETQEKDSSGAELAPGPRGFLSIDHKGGRFLMPLQRIVSVSRHEFLVDGGGMVHELTIDTDGSVVARYYFLASPLENTPLNAAQIVNDRLKQVENLIQERTGQDTRVVVKHYPTTTHAKTVEFNVASLELLERIYQHIYSEWVERGGKEGRTLRIR